MSRVVSSTNAAELAKSSIIMCMAVDLDFPSGHLRLHDGPGTLSIGGNAFEGTGKIQIFDKIEESIQVIAKPVKLMLSGVDASLIATARAGGYQNRSVTIYMCLFDHITGALADTPEVAWEGRMDTIRISLGRNEANMTLNCEHRLRREPRIARFTNQDQQLAYPGDRFFDLVPKIPGYVGKWGEREVKAPTPGPSPKYPSFRQT